MNEFIFDLKEIYLFPTQKFPKAEVMRNLNIDYAAINNYMKKFARQRVVRCGQRFIHADFAPEHLK